MPDRASAPPKQNVTTTAAVAQFPSTIKTHLYNRIRQPYVPASPPRNHRNFSCRRCFCLSCFWAALLLIGIFLLAAIAAAVLYALYCPHRPAFSVTAVRISYFNLTTAASDGTTSLTTKMNLTISAKNSNKKAIFYFDPISVTAFSDSGILSNWWYADPFTSSPGSIFIIHATMGLDSQILDTDSLHILNSNLKRKNGLPMKIVMDTIMGVKLEKMKMNKIGIRVKCDGIKGLMPRGKEAAPANTSDAKCKVDFRIKILKWTF